MKAVQAKARIALKSILFATDFSPAADAAVPFAIQIARSYGAKVYGAHVNAVNDYTAVAPEAWTVMVEASENDAKEQTQRLNEQLNTVEHEVVISQGNITETIASVIKEKEIDLVVVGTRGRTKLGKALLGSVAEQILRRAPCAVLTVGPHVTMQLPRAPEIREIVYATDLGAEFPAAAPYAISLAQENQAHLVLLHVIEDRKTGELVSSSEVVDSKMRKLRQLVPPEAELWCQPGCFIEQGAPAEKILAVANRLHADLIVLGARPAKGLATHLDMGTVHKVVSQATCPVLTVRG
jgi:nucleotide-binding universal stress UspA family protein